MLHPPASVAEHLVLSPHDLGPNVRVSLKRERTAVEGSLDVVLAQDVQQTPARLPYSKKDSLARSRWSEGAGDGTSLWDSPCASPSSSEYSEPSS